MSPYLAGVEMTTRPYAEETTGTVVFETQGHAVVRRLSAMTTQKLCQRQGCRNLVQPPYRSYCSDACRDTAQRAKVKTMLAHKAGGLTAKRLYRYYPKSEST